MKQQPLGDAALLAHMRDCIERIREYTALDRQRFESSRLVQDAAVRNLQVLTESSQRLSDAARNGEPGIPWRKLAGFRNVLVHGYLGIDLEAVWSVIEQDLPARGSRGTHGGYPMTGYPAWPNCGSACSRTGISAPSGNKACTRAVTAA